MLPTENFPQPHSPDKFWLLPDWCIQGELLKFAQLKSINWFTTKNNFVSCSVSFLKIKRLLPGLPQCTTDLQSSHIVTVLDLYYKSCCILLLCSCNSTMIPATDYIYKHKVSELFLSTIHICQRKSFIQMSDISVSSNISAVCQPLQFVKSIFLQHIPRNTNTI